MHGLGADPAFIEDIFFFFFLIIYYFEDIIGIENNLSRYLSEPGVCVCVLFKITTHITLNFHVAAFALESIGVSLFMCL
jgi:hypothetical protein